MEFVHCNTGGGRTRTRTRRRAERWGPGGRGGVTLAGRPEHSFYSRVVTEMMGWARLGSHKEWSDGVEAANIVKYRRIRRPGGPQL